MYADGGAEEVTGEAVKGRRDAVFIVSKVVPKNASRRGTIEAAERSLRRLGTDRIDLYLLHWPGEHPLQDTLDAFAQLVDEQKIVHYGVSNFDAAAMQACESLRGGPGVVANQVALQPRPAQHRAGPAAVVRRARDRRDGLFAARTGARLAGRRLGRGRAAPRRQRGMRRPGLDAAATLGCIDSQRRWTRTICAPTARRCRWHCRMRTWLPSTRISRRPTARCHSISFDAASLEVCLAARNGVCWTTMQTQRNPALSKG